MLRKYKPPEGKRIQVYKSGDIYYKGKSMVLNPMHVKTMDNFLSNITSKIDPDWGAVRSIHTPKGGTIVENLESINREGVYVAAGSKGFVSIPGGYENIGKPEERKKQLGKYKFIHRSGPKKEYFNIKVFRNGDGKAPVPFRFSKQDFTNWEQALYRLNEKLRLPQGPIKRFYHLNGKIVRSPSDLVNNGSYVAVGSNEPFRQSDYEEGVEGEPGTSNASKGAVPKYTKARRAKNTRQESDISQNKNNNSSTRTLPRFKITRKKKEKVEEEEERRRFSSNSKAKKIGPGRAVANVRVTHSSEKEDNSHQDERRTTSRRNRPLSVVSSKLQSRPKPQSRRNSIREPSRGNTGQSSKSRLNTRGGNSRQSTKRDSETAEDNGQAKASNQGQRRKTYGRVPSPVTGEVPHQIPENLDTESIDYFRLQSRQTTPLQSPYETPTNSAPSSPRTGHGILNRRNSLYSMPEPIAEENEDEEQERLSAVEEVNSDKDSLSRLSFIDSGHASLILSDEDRPDSVFRAKTRSRPVTTLEVNYDTDDGGIFRSKSKSDYMKGAKEILDSSVTEIELPIDLIDATEVQEEVLVS